MITMLRPASLMCAPTMLLVVLLTRSVCGMLPPDGPTQIAFKNCVLGVGVARWIWSRRHPLLFAVVRLTPLCGMSVFCTSLLGPTVAVAVFPLMLGSFFVFKRYVMGTVANFASGVTRSYTTT